MIPSYQTSQDLNAKIVEVNEVLKKTDAAQGLIDETATILGSISEDSNARFALLVPEELDRLRFSNMLQRMAQSRGIILADIKVERISDATGGAPRSAPPQDGNASAGLTRVLTLDKSVTAPGEEGGVVAQIVEKNYIATNVSFSFGATYPTFLSFLADLERSIGIINITELSFEPFPSVTDTGKVTKGKVEPLYMYHVKAETYSLK